MRTIDQTASGPPRRGLARNPIVLSIAMFPPGTYDSLAKKYLGKDKYPYASPDQIGVIFEIEPGKVQAQG